MSSPSLPNRLAQESSPYLQLHAHQPVDWYPWGEDVLQKAACSQTPLFLSIGYSTCHWCHVMARESFEDPEIAAFLNAHFLAIKLDREERPDLDHLYMTAHQAMHEGAGGWPLNLFLTPEGKAFYSGTYFPPRDREGRVGFDQILRGVWDAWTHKRQEIFAFGSSLVTQIVQNNQNSPHPTGELGTHFTAHTQSLLRTSGDSQFGGWGRGPKFPHASLLRFLLRSARREDQEFALFTCRTMGKSGLYDHLHGGFHRYCVDAEWIVPHFEKMLYDQGQLIEVYLDAYSLTGDPFYARIARETSQYLLREMRSPSGAFYSAQDAQSEGKEGRFSCWTLEELEALLDPEELALAHRLFVLSREGNFLDFSDPAPLGNQIVLTLRELPESLSPAEQARSRALKDRLFAIRAERTPPATDQKILFDWNALVIAALARAAHVFDDPKLLEAATQADEALLKTHWFSPELFHSWKEGQCHGQNLGSDFLHFLRVSRILYEATLEPSYLKRVLALPPQILSQFYDSDEGGFFETSAASTLVMRLKGEADAATPSTSSYAVREFHLLSLLTEEPAYHQALSKTKAFYSAALQTTPHQLGGMLYSLASNEQSALLTLHGAKKEALLPFVQTAFQQLNRPLIVWSESSQDLALPSPPAARQKPVALLCRGTECLAPVSEVGALRDLLQSQTGGPSPL